MGKPYGMALREPVIAAIESGMSTHQTARFSIGIATAGTWARLKRATGSVAPARQGKPKDSVLDAHAAFIGGLIDETPDITLKEIAAQLASERAVTVWPTAVWKFLRRRNMTRKKRPLMRANETAPMSKRRVRIGLKTSTISILNG